jgi:hypothetical protein
VTVLGYEAMEPRGEPRGPAIEDADTSRLLNAVLDEGITPIERRSTAVARGDGGRRPGRRWSLAQALAAVRLIAPGR